MKAEPGRTYTQIIDGRVHWIFTADTLPEWKDDAFVTVDITDLNPQPAIGWSWDGAILSPPPLPTLQQRRQERRREFNKRREDASALGVVYAGKTIDTDPVSIQKINGAVTMAVIATLNAQPFSITWTCADDSSIVLTAAELMGMGVTVGAYIDSLHQRTRVAKDALLAANTLDDINAVVW